MVQGKFKVVQGLVQGEPLENTEKFKRFKVNIIFFYI
jgi:hypothetical protein